VDRHIDEETYASLLKELERFKEMAEELHRKHEEKLWAAPIAVPLRLSQALAGLTKDELTQIRQNLRIKNISTLRKPELVTKLREVIPHKAKDIFRLFDLDRYELVKRIVDGGGFAFVPRPNIRRVEYLRSRGIAFSGSVDGRSVLAVPEEIAEEFRRVNDKECRRLVRRNTEWVRLTHGMLYYYGVVGSTDLFRLLRKYFGEEADTAELFRVLYESLDYYEEIEMIGTSYAHADVWDPQRVIDEHRARPDVEYYPFTKNQLLRAGESGFVDRNAAHKEFVAFLAHNFEISPEKADSIAQECVYAANAGERLSDIVRKLLDEFEMESMDMLQALLDQLTRLINNTRQWFLKGYTPAELYEREKEFLRPLPAKGADVIDLRTGRKIGRNDPCPCGSGKKFKKCCGR